MNQVPKFRQFMTRNDWHIRIVRKVDRLEMLFC